MRSTVRRVQSGIRIPSAGDTMLHVSARDGTQHQTRCGPVHESPRPATVRASFEQRASRTILSHRKAHGSTRTRNRKQRRTIGRRGSHAPTTQRHGHEHDTRHTTHSACHRRPPRSGRSDHARDQSSSSSDPFSTARRGCGEPAQNARAETFMEQRGRPAGAATGGCRRSNRRVKMRDCDGGHTTQSHRSDHVEGRTRSDPAYDGRHRDRSRPRAQLRPAGRTLCLGHQAVTAVAVAAR